MIQKPSGLAILRGVALLARFRAEGLDCFGGGVQQVLGSLAPLLTLPVVFLVVMLLSGGDGHEMAELLSVIDALLVQIALSEALARRWGREAEWGRYAVAFNWCQWAVPVVGMALMVGLRVLVDAGFPPTLAAPLAVLALACYALALQWFVARHGLRVGSGRAAFLVLGVNLCTAAVVVLPAQLRLWMEAAP